MKKSNRAAQLFTLEARIKRDLRKHLKNLGFQKDKRGHLLPPSQTKEAFKALHWQQRVQKINNEADFVRKNLTVLSQFFANGDEVVPEKIAVRIELISGDTWQSRLFRLASLVWSVPVSQGYGRRLRFLIWDDYNGKLIGLLALGDPVFNMRVRDEWIGWTVRDRESRLVNVLDAYVVGAVYPYNQILCGKLVACLIKCQEIYQIFTDKYGGSKGVISNESKKARLALVTTSSALGRSSLYNRLKLEGEPFLVPIGFTSGWGHFHIPDTLFDLMRQYLAKHRDAYAGNNRYGDGPNWKLRAARKALAMAGLDANLMRHGIQREVFVCPLGKNVKEFLRGGAKRLNVTGLKSVSEIADMAKSRWILRRAVSRQEYRSFRREMLADLLIPQMEENFEISTLVLKAG